MAKFPGAVQFPVRWWGFPTVHAPRRVKPTILLVCHQTGNGRLPSAEGEAAFSNRDGSSASFTFVTNRDGSVVQCLDPVTQVAWTNGDVNQPNLSLPTVKAAVASGKSVNEWCFATAENVAYDVRPERRAPITDAQKETLAQIAAWGSKITGLPINRNTVIGHADINSVTRAHCPTAGDLDRFLGGIIERANEIAEGGEDPTVIEELKAALAECKEVAARRWRRIVAMTARIKTLNTEVETLEAELDEALAAAQTAEELRVRVRSLRNRIESIKTKIAAAAEDVADD